MLVSDIMTVNPSTMDWQDTVSTVRNARFPAYVVTKNGQYYGIIAKADIISSSISDTELIDRYVKKNAFTTSPDIDIAALKNAIDNAIKNRGYKPRFIPVIDKLNVAGVITCNDIDSKSYRSSQLCDSCGEETDDLISMPSGETICQRCYQEHLDMLD